MVAEVVVLDTYRNVAEVAADELRAEYREEAWSAYEKLSSCQKEYIDAGGQHMLGFEKRGKKWKGYLPFYLFKCWSCRNPSKSYPQGYRGYLTCKSCGERNGEVWWWRHRWLRIRVLIASQFRYSYFNYNTYGEK